MLPQRLSHHPIHPKGLTTMKPSSQELNRETGQELWTNSETFGKPLPLSRPQFSQKYHEGIGSIVLKVLSYSHPVTFSVEAPWTNSVLSYHHHYPTTTTTTKRQNTAMCMWISTYRCLILAKLPQALASYWLPS